MRVLIVVPAVLAVTSPAVGQMWGDSASRALVERGIARRTEAAASGLTNFRARAHGFVFFLAQLGAAGLEEPPRLVKSDQLELEVYWQASGRSKQRIIGWRDRAELPTDIQYHRDHLGIVLNGFGDRIRLGEGDEVRDVPHPLARDGPRYYEYALIDSIRIDLPGRSIRALELAFRPTEFTQPRIVGSLFLDADGGELVRMEFSFTRAAYLDESLEDIAVVLENGLWDGRYWLPRQQEIEIRRRSTWLDVPARGIIRGRWDIDGYSFNQDIPDRVFVGPEIVAAPTARDSFPWPETLDAAVQRELGPGAPLRLSDVRKVAQSLAGPRSISGLRTHGPSIGAASEVIHVNRVEGLTVGLGYMLRPGAGPFRVRAHAAFGMSGDRVTGGLALAYRLGAWRIGLSGDRSIRDLADEPAISGILNSFLAQEGGHDYGDYVRLDQATATLGSDWLEISAGYVATDSLMTTASPVRGSYAPNPNLSSGNWWTGGVTVRGQTDAVVDASLRGSVALEGGVQTGRRFARVRLTAGAVRPVGPGEVRAEAWAGWGSADLPMHRLFVFGGRGSLVGEPYRAYGGRRAAVARLAWAVPLPAPAVPLGRYASTGRQLTVAPYVAAGWADRDVTGLPWVASDGIRPVVGITADVFHRLLQFDFGWAPRQGAVGLTVDIRRDLWPVL